MKTTQEKLQPKKYPVVRYIVYKDQNNLFEYEDYQKAVRDLKIFNKERDFWDAEYYLFKRVKQPRAIIYKKKI